ncbi:DNA-binding transcriptional regulator, LysR family [Duganella sp. CF402]|uniref:LysR family transcriptional regulator n=1 Tax=unclassified Duganella TaxID=2636909 RepID=UPI0008B1601E|nr:MULTISPECIES: LysR family transcriptional regulator [unclassified Duganella]RZT09284.1 LysR family transcriptional regulator [Duganella sp. BK701]SEL63309.1 DNA-binding transcriptional regulator, LysR family [Duganella sp. CF402]
MRFNRLDLNLLLALDALLKEQNITRAAARVNVSQSAMSGMLARLREFFEDELLAAVGRNMEPTVLGRQLEAPVRDLILHIQATVGMRVNFDPAKETRIVKIMVSDYATEVFLNRVVARVLRDAPNMTLDLVPLSDDASEQLRRGENDFLIIPRHFLAEEHPQRLLFEDSYCAVIWEGNTQVGDVLDAETYLRLPHVAPMLGRPRSATFEELMLQGQGVQRRIRVTTSDFVSMASVLIGTDLVATMHTRLAQSCARRLPVRLLPLPYTLPLMAECVQWHRFQENDPCHIWLRGVMLEVAKAMPPHEVLATQVR